MTDRENSKLETLERDVSEIRESMADWFKWFRGLIIGALSIAGALAVGLYRVETNASTLAKHDKMLQEPRFSRADYEREEAARATYIDLYLKTILEKVDRIEKNMQRE